MSKPTKEELADAEDVFQRQAEAEAAELAAAQAPFNDFKASKGLSDIKKTVAGILEAQPENLLSAPDAARLGALSKALSLF